MLSNAETGQFRTPLETELRQVRDVATRRVWLPKLLYDCLPWFYVIAGIGAILATLYVNDWFWILPHYVIFSAGCLHLGAIVFRRRGMPDRRTSGDGAHAGRAGGLDVS